MEGDCVSSNQLGMNFNWLLKVINPIWIVGASHRQLIIAFYLYPIFNKEVTNKLLAGFFFYSSFAVLAWNCISHGLLFNFYDGLTTLAKLSAYHPNLPFLFKLAKIIVAIAMAEIFIMRFYIVFLYIGRRHKLETLLNLESFSDLESTRKIRTWTQWFCLSNSFLVSIVCFTFYTYGMEETDNLGKAIAIALTVISWYQARFSVCELYLVYSYFILLVNMILRFTSQIVSFSSTFLAADETSRGLNDVDSLRVKYYLVLKMIRETSELMSVLTLTGKLLAVPIMTLAWVLFFEETASFFQSFFKWFLFLAAVYYSSRVYLIIAHLSRAQSQSQKLYMNLHSIIAREKVNLTGKKTLLFISENISSRLNKMAFHDTYGSIVEQRDVLKSISVTLELLLLGFTFKNNI